MSKKYRNTPVESPWPGLVFVSLAIVALAFLYMTARTMSEVPSPITQKLSLPAVEQSVK